MDYNIQESDYSGRWLRLTDVDVVQQGKPVEEDQNSITRELTKE